MSVFTYMKVLAFHGSYPEIIKVCICLFDSFKKLVADARISFSVGTIEKYFSHRKIYINEISEPCKQLACI